MSVSSVIIEQINAIIRSLVPLNNPIVANIDTGNKVSILIGTSIHSIITSVQTIHDEYNNVINLSDKTNAVAALINVIKDGLVTLINNGVPRDNAGGAGNTAAAINLAGNAAATHIANPLVPAAVAAAAGNLGGNAANAVNAAYRLTNIRVYVAEVHTFITVLNNNLLLIIAATTHINLFPSLPLAPVDTIPNPANLSTKFYVVLLNGTTKAVEYVGHRIYNIANHTPITSFVHCRKNNVRDSVGVQLEILANYDGSRITDSATGIASPDNLKTWLLKYMTDDNLTADKAYGYLKDQDTFKAASAYTLDNTFTKPPADIILGGSKKNKRHRQIKSKSRKYKSKGGQADLNTIIANATNAIF